MVKVEGVCLRLPVEVASVRVARRAVEAQAIDDGVRPGVVDTLRVVTSELVTNAVRAAVSLVEVRFVCSDGVARLEVDDDGDGWPMMREGSEHGGFGLRLVDELAAQWGLVSHVGYKTVFAELRVTSER